MPASLLQCRHVLFLVSLQAKQAVILTFDFESIVSLHSRLFFVTGTASWEANCWGQFSGHSAIASVKALKSCVHGGCCMKRRLEQQTYVFPTCPFTISVALLWTVSNNETFLCCGTQNHTLLWKAWESTGPKIEPWGTSLVSGCQPDVTPVTKTLKNNGSSKTVLQGGVLSGWVLPSSSLCFSPFCGSRDPALQPKSSKNQFSL